MNRIIAGTILENDGKVLLVKENQNRDKRKWWITAGGVDEGEFIEEAAIRETIDGELRFDSEEIAEAKWFSYDEIISIKDTLRNPLPILKCIEMLKKGNVLPLDTILKT